MAGDANWLVDGTREFDNLIITTTIDVPKSNSCIITDSDDIAFCKVEIHTQNRVCVRSKHSLVFLVCLVQNTKTTIKSPTSHSETIRRDVNSADCSLVLGFHEEVAEV